MSRCTRSTPRSRDRRIAAKSGAAGFTSVELLVGIALMSLAMAATSSFFLASNSQMRQQALRTEADQAARAAVDMMIRDLRLGGACLPVTGDFISLDGFDDDEEDEIITRTGLVRPDMSCVRTAMSGTTDDGETVLEVENSNGFEAGMRIYLRHPSGAGEYATIALVDEPLNEITLDTGVTQDFVPTTGVYAIDERRFFLDATDEDLPQLMLRIGDDDPFSFAVGIEKLDFRYVLRRNCPPCDIVDLPASESEWAIVEQVLVDLTARSELKDASGDFYRRAVTVAVKPRNLLPR